MKRFTSPLCFPLVLVGLTLFTSCVSRAPAPPTTPVPPPVASVLPPPVAPSGIRLISGLLPPMPLAVTSFGAASDGRYLYTLGGYSGEPHAYSSEGQNKQLMRVPLDGSTGWQELPGLGRGLQGLTLVQHAGQLCRAGGTEARNAAGTPADMHSVAEAACYDPAGSSWRDLPALPAGRSSHGAAVIGDVLYVVGGWSLSGAPATGTFQEDMLALDLRGSGGWSSIKAPFKRRALGVAEAAGQLVIVGGIGADGEPSRRVDLFDPLHKTFSQGPDFPDDAFGVAVASAGDAVLASARSGVVYRFAPGQAGWQAVANLAFARFFHQLVISAPGELLAVGGISGMHNQGRTLHVERVMLGAAADQLRVLAWSMAYPGKAKNRQGVFVHGDYVYLFGGNNSLEQHDFAPGNFMSEMWRLHLPSLELQALTAFPANRQTIQTVSGEEHGLALGGFGHDGEKAVSFADGYRFDFESERWTPSVRLPESRTQFGLTEHGGELWVFGGLNYDPSRKDEAAFAHVTRVLHARPGVDSVFAEAPASLPGERRAFAGGLLGDSYYLLGGMRGGFDLVPDCLRYDFKSGTFSALACPGPARLSGTLVPMNERLYLLGGSVQSGDTLASAQDVLELEPTGASRSVLARLPFDSRHMHAIPFKGRILLISTHNNEGRINLAILSPAAQAAELLPTPLK